jgi:hypothetical protein
MNTFLIAGITVIVYAIIQFIDAKMIQKEKPDIKAIVKRSIMVFSSVMISTALYDQVSPLLGDISDKVSTVSGGGIPKVFTDKPSF